MSQYIIFNLANLFYYVTINFTVIVDFIVIAGREKLLCNLHNSYASKINILYVYKPIPEQGLE